LPEPSALIPAAAAHIITAPSIGVHPDQDTSRGQGTQAG
jgi:hypothetical protein